MPIANWHKLRLPWPAGPYVGSYPQEDPREVLANRAKVQQCPDGWVMVKASDIRDVYEMRVCRSTHDFDHDEDGPMQTTTAHCVLEAGHRGRHSNGYFSWDADGSHIDRNGSGGI